MTPVHQSERQFWEAIREDPTGNPQRVYADWLEDQGDPRAEWVRASLASDGEIESADYLIQGVREHLLFQKFRGEIAGSARELTNHISTFGGMIVPKMSLENFGANAETLLSDSPTLGIKVTKSKGSYREECGELSELVVLDTTNARRSECRQLFRRDTRSNLQWLNAGDATKSREFRDAICGGCWPKLKSARLGLPKKKDCGEIFRSETMRQLQHLGFDYFYGECPELLETVADADRLPNLESLEWPNAMKGHPAVGEWTLPKLRYLDLRGEWIKVEEMNELFSNPGLQALETCLLLVQGGKIGAEHIPKNPVLRLKNLSITGDFSQAGVDSLLNSDWFPKLKTFRCHQYDDIWKTSASAWRESQLKNLVLSGGRMPAASVAEIGKKGGWTELESLDISASETSMRELARIEFKQLRRLDVTGSLNKEALRQLVDAPWFKQLEVLQLSCKPDVLSSLGVLESNLKVLLCRTEVSKDDLKVLHDSPLESLEFIGLDIRNGNKALVKKLRGRLQSASRFVAANVGDVYSNAISGLAPPFPASSRLEKPFAS